MRQFNSFIKMFLKHRADTNLTQAEVARRLKFRNAQQVSNFERGLHFPSPKVLKKYIKAYGINEADALEKYEAIVIERIRSEFGYRSKNKSKKAS